MSLDLSDIWRSAIAAFQHRQIAVIVLSCVVFTAAVLVVAAQRTRRSGALRTTIERLAASETKLIDAKAKLEHALADSEASVSELRRARETSTAEIGSAVRAAMTPLVTDLAAVLEDARKETRAAREEARLANAKANRLARWSSVLAASAFLLALFLATATYIYPPPSH